MPAKNKYEHLVSVVIPNYNHGRFVGDAIRSVLNQIYQSFEIIVVDDGSTDNSREVVAQFGNRVQYIWQQNKGLPGARNKGLLAACGKYIAFLDSDDCWLPAFLQTTLERLEADLSLGAVHTGFFFMDSVGGLLPQVGTYVVPDDQMYDRLLDGEFFMPSSVVVRRTCFEKVGLFDETLRFSEDWDMWLRVAREFRFAGIPEPLLKYRIHGNNMTSNPEKNLRYQGMVIAKHFGLLDGLPETWPRERQRAAAWMYRFAAQGFYHQGDQLLGQRYMQLALEANPSLAHCLDWFYELGCVDKPLGQRGDSTQLRLEKNATVLFESLDKIFSQPDISSRLRVHKNEAYGYAFWALGMLAYISSNFHQARIYLWRALLTEPALRKQLQLWITLLKALLGKRLLWYSKSIISFAKRML